LYGEQVDLVGGDDIISQVLAPAVDGLWSEVSLKRSNRPLRSWAHRLAASGAKGEADLVDDDQER